MACAPAGPPAVTPPAPLLAECKELADPIHDLRDLVTDARSYERDPPRPLYPSLMASKLTADAAIARAVTSTDQELLRIAAGTADLLAALAGKARALAEADASNHDATHATAGLIEAIKAGDPVWQRLSERCVPRPPAAKVMSGRMPPEVIQKIVRSRFGVFRRCYEDGLRKDPTLMGRAAIRFVIERDGSVSEVTDIRSALPAPFVWESTPLDNRPPLPVEVSGCIVEGFKQFTFPPPEGGIVIMTLPITLSSAPK